MMALTVTNISSQHSEETRRDRKIYWMINDNTSNYSQRRFVVSTRADESFNQFMSKARSATGPHITQLYYSRTVPGGEGDIHQISNNVLIKDDDSMILGIQYCDESAAYDTKKGVFVRITAV